MPSVFLTTDKLADLFRRSNLVSQLPTDNPGGGMPWLHATGSILVGAGSVQSALTFANPLVLSGGQVSMPASTSGQSGYLAFSDWLTFAAKQDDLGYVPLDPALNLSELASPGVARGNLGLGSAAVQDQEFFATAAQGVLADSAIQTSDIDTVAKLNGIVSDTLIVSSDPRLSDDRNPTAHVHVIADTTGLQGALDGKSAVGHGHVIDDVADLQGTLDLKADLVGGVLPVSQLPAIAIAEYLGDSANQAAMLALTGQKGDWTTRTDLGTTWLISGDDPTQLASWTQLSYPTAPVSSVNSQTGAVNLGAADVGAAPAIHTHTASAITDFDTAVNNNAAVAANTAKVTNATHTGDVTGSGALTIAAGAVNTAKLGGDITTAGKALLDDADAAAQRTTLGLGTAATQSTGFFATAAQGTKADTALQVSSIDTLAELNAILTDADLISTTDPRLSDARTPLAHTHTASAITDFASAVSSNSAVAANTAKVTNATHTGDVTGSGALTIAAGAVTTTKLGGDITAAGKALLDDADAAAQRTTLGLGTAATFASTAFAAASHTHAIGDVSNLQTALDGKAASTHTHVIADTTGLQTALDGKAASSHTHAIGDVTNLQTTLNNKADLVGGVLSSSQIPAIAITEYLGSAANQAAMLALSGQKGDWTIRTDLGTTWVITGTDPTQLSSWTALSYPTAPVSSVNSYTGAVVLSAADVGASPTGHTHTASNITDFATAVSSNSAVAANTAKVTNATHTGDVTGATSLTIANGAVNTAKLGGDITTAGKALLDDADAAAQRTTLGLGSAATQSSGTFAAASHGHAAADITSGTLSADRLATGTSLQALRRNATNTALEFFTLNTTSGDMLSANNLSDVQSVSSARTNLGLGSAALQATSYFATAAQGTLADTALQTTSINTLAKLNAIVGQTLIITTDSRLSDARTPLAHNHAATEITSGVLAADRLATGTGLQALRRNTGNTALEFFTLGSLATLSTVNNGQWSGTALSVANGGTGSTTAANARTALGLGTLATLSSVNDGNWSGTALAVANGGTGATTATAARTSLGLGSLAVLNTVNNGNWSGTALAVANGGTGGTTQATARTGLGLGTAATNNTGDFATAVHTHAIGDVTNLQTTLNAKADLVGGVLSSSQVPAIAITEFLGNTANQTAMLALSGQKGDWTIRTDLGTTWVITGTDPSVIGGWTQLSYPGAPVTSVNSYTGAVTLSAADVGASPTGHTHTASAITDFASAVSSNSAVAANTAKVTNATHTGDVTGSTALTIANGAVSTTKLGGDITTAGKALLDDADAAAQRTTLGLGTAATFASTAFATASHSHAATDITSGVLAADRLATGTGLQALRRNSGNTALEFFTLGSLATLSSVNNGNWSGTSLAVANGGTGASTAADARTNLGLGTLATLSSVNNSQWSGTALAVANGGTGAVDAPTARTNLGLGTAATSNTGDFAAASHTHSQYALLTGAAFTGDVSTTGGMTASSYFLLNGGQLDNTGGLGPRIFSGSGKVTLQSNTGVVEIAQGGSEGFRSNMPGGGFTIENPISPDTIATLAILPRGTQLAPLLSADGTTVNSGGAITFKRWTPKGSTSSLDGLANVGEIYFDNAASANGHAILKFDASARMNGVTDQFGMNYRTNGQFDFGFLNSARVQFSGLGGNAGAGALIGGWDIRGGCSIEGPVNLTGANASSNDVRWQISRSGTGGSQAIYGYTQRYAVTGDPPTLTLGAKSITLGAYSDGTATHPWNDNSHGSELKITKGMVTVPAGSIIAGNGPGLQVGADAGYGLAAGGGNFGFWAGGTLALNITPGFREYRVPSDYQYCWASSTNNNSAADTRVKRYTAGEVVVTDANDLPGGFHAKSINAWNGGSLLAQLTTTSAGGTPSYAYGKLSLANAENTAQKAEIFVAEDPWNTAVNALYITPASHNNRLFFGGNGKSFYSIDFASVGRFDSVPMFDIGGFTFGTYGGGVAYSIGRSSDHVYLRSSSPTGGAFVFETGASYGVATARLLIDKTGQTWLGSGCKLGWGSNADASLSQIETGFSRVSSGVVSLTDGSGVRGQLQLASIYLDSTVAGASTGDVLINASAPTGAAQNNILIGTPSSGTGQSLTTGSYNTVVGGIYGQGAGQALTSGGSNAFFGMRAGSTVTTGAGNVCIGAEANTSAGANYTVAVGQQAGRLAVNDTESVYIGYGAGQLTTGAYNVLIGRSVGYNETLTSTLRIGTQGTYLHGDLASGIFGAWHSGAPARFNAHGINLRSGSADVTTSDLLSGYTTIWKNTTTGSVALAINDSGTIRKIHTSPYLTITNFEMAAVYAYYGGTRDGAWRINRYDRATKVRTSATVANNGAYSTLGTAWTNRATLTYA